MKCLDFYDVDEDGSLTLAFTLGATGVKADWIDIIAGKIEAVLHSGVLEQPLYDENDKWVDPSEDPFGFLQKCSEIYSGSRFRTGEIYEVNTALEYLASK